MQVVAWLLVVLLAGVAAFLAWTIHVTQQRVDEAEAEVAELRRTYESDDDAPAIPGLRMAGRMVGAMVGTAQQTAQRWRDHGVTGILVGSLEDFVHWTTDRQPDIARIAATDGTVTILFSDIEGSTRLNAAVGDARWVKVLAAHNDVIETYVEKYRGLVVKTQGDGYMVVFTTPELAADAALDIQRSFQASWNRRRELRRTPIRVRIGLHTGTAIERDGDFFGKNVALAARVAASAEGGMILASDEVAAALGDAYDLCDLGPVELKGFDEPQSVWRLDGAA